MQRRRSIGGGRPPGVYCYCDETSFVNCPTHGVDWSPLDFDTYMYFDLVRESWLSWAIRKVERWGRDLLLRTGRGTL